MGVSRARMGHSDWGVDRARHVVIEITILIIAKAHTASTMFHDALC